MGLAIQTYYAILATPVLLLLLFIHRVLAGKWRSRAAGGLLALTFAAAALAYGPVYQYARLHPEQFAQRLSTVSILKVQSASELLDLFRDDERRAAFLHTLQSNTVKHLRMFHLVGDPNGRHNLPGEPMLDPITGLFLAIGAAWCLLLVYRSEMGLLAAWFVAMIAAGILSLDFEAPQGARSSGLPAVIALIAAIPLERASRAARAPARPAERDRRRRARGGPAGRRRRSSIGRRTSTGSAGMARRGRPIRRPRPRLPRW